MITLKFNEYLSVIDGNSIKIPDDGSLKDFSFFDLVMTGYGFEVAISNMLI